jgi:arginase
MKNIKILAVNIRSRSRNKGASLGFDAIKIAALDFGSTFFQTIPEEVVKDENHMLLEPARSVHARRGKGVLEVCQRMSQAVEKTLRDGNFPIVLAGDHSSAAGTIAGIKAAFPESRIAVIWIDAHADLHSPYTTPSGNMHGMPPCHVAGRR